MNLTHFAKGASKSNIVAVFIAAVIEMGHNTYKYAKGEISGREFTHETAGAVGGTAGGIGGGAAGTIIGTMILPGIGTAVGGLIGIIGGTYAGSSATKKIARHFFR